MKLWDKLSSPEQLIIGTGVLLLTSVCAFVLQSLTTSIVKFYEGYTLPEWTKAWFLRNQFERRQRMLHAREGNALYFNFPRSEQHVLPTRLGNVIRAAEVYSYDLVGLDSVLWWPRLSPKLPTEFRTQIDAAVLPLICLLNLCSLFLVGTVVSGAILIYNNAHWSLFLVNCSGGFIVAYLCYAASITQAKEYGNCLRAAIDLYRHEILRQMRIPLPKTVAEEIILWRCLTDWIFVNNTTPGLEPENPFYFENDKSDSTDVSSMPANASSPESRQWAFVDQLPPTTPAAGGVLHASPALRPAKPPPPEQIAVSRTFAALRLPSLPTDATSLRLEQKDAHNTFKEVESDLTSESTSVAGLTPNQTYEFRVVAVNPAAAPGQNETVSESLRLTTPRTGSVPHLHVSPIIVALCGTLLLFMQNRPGLDTAAGQSQVRLQRSLAAYSFVSRRDLSSKGPRGQKLAAELTDSITRRALKQGSFIQKSDVITGVSKQKYFQWLKIPVAPPPNTFPGSRVQLVGLKGNARVPGFTPATALVLEATSKYLVVALEPRHARAAAAYLASNRQLQVIGTIVPPKP